MSATTFSLLKGSEFEGRLWFCINFEQKSLYYRGQKISNDFYVTFYNNIVLHLQTICTIVAMIQIPLWFTRTPSSIEIIGTLISFIMRPSINM